MEENASGSNEKGRFTEMSKSADRQKKKKKTSFTSLDDSNKMPNNFFLPHLIAEYKYIPCWRRPLWR